MHQALYLIHSVAKVGCIQVYPEQRLHIIRLGWHQLPGTTINHKTNYFPQPQWAQHNSPQHLIELDHNCRLSCEFHVLSVGSRDNYYSRTFEFPSTVFSLSQAVVNPHEAQLRGIIVAVSKGDSMPQGAHQLLQPL